MPSTYTVSAYVSTYTMSAYRIIMMSTYNIYTSLSLSLSLSLSPSLSLSLSPDRDGGTDVRAVAAQAKRLRTAGAAGEGVPTRAGA